MQTRRTNWVLVTSLLVAFLNWELLHPVRRVKVTRILCT